MPGLPLWAICHSFSYPWSRVFDQTSRSFTLPFRFELFWFEPNRPNRYRIGPHLAALPYTVQDIDILRTVPCSFTYL